MPTLSAPNGLDHLWHQLTGLTPGALRPVRAHLSGKRILLTGAGGFIGSALAGAIARSQPESLILLDSSEHSLYQIDRDLSHSGVACAAILGSVSDRALLNDLFHHHRPQIVIHAAACKHVPLMEQNPFAAIANNALGTWALARTAALHPLHPAEQLLLVSTDKAVDPHSLMGASKRIAELILLALSGNHSLATRPATQRTAVRLGNVLGSHGSVVPLFLDQIAQGGPLTVTHPEARRYFLTLEQSVEALLDALEAPSPDPASILVPELAPPIRILDLARHLIAQQASATEIAFTGLRPGDKLEESLIATRERWLPRVTANLRAIASPAPTANALEAAMHALDQTLQQRDLDAMLRTVLELVPEYTPSALLAGAIRHSCTAAEEGQA
ncbi:MAG TPA: polysaccharide biosynthesis protein [Granulicella sp.]|nr:polysaccharide biosynthesis protein [Granulicella sp.]